MSWFDLQIQEVWSRLGQNRVWFDAGTALRQPEGTSGLLTNTSSSPLTSDARFGHQLPSQPAAHPPFLRAARWLLAPTYLTKGEEGQEVGGTCQTCNWAPYIAYIG